MQIEMLRSAGVTELRMRGAVGGGDRETLLQQMEAIWAQTPRSLLVDLDEATLDAPCRALVLALLVHVTAEGGSSALVSGQIEFAQTFARLALARVAKLCPRRGEAERALLARLRKRYDNRFFSLLVDGGHLDRNALKGILDAYKQGGGQTPLGDLLMDRAHLAPRLLIDLLAEAAQDEADGLANIRELARQVPQADVAEGRPLISGVPGANQALSPSERGRSDSPVSEFVRPRLLGEILVEMNVITEAQLRMVLEEQRSAPSDEKIGDTLLRLGLVTTNQLFQALESQLTRKGASAGTFAPDTPPQTHHEDGPGSASAGGSGSEFFQSSLLGQLLIREGLISEEDLRAALDEQRKSDGEERLGDILVRLGSVKPSDLFLALERQARS